MTKCDFTFRHGCSPANLLHIFTTPFPWNSSGGLLLTCYRMRHQNTSSAIFKTVVIFVFSGTVFNYMQIK